MSDDLEAARLEVIASAKFWEEHVNKYGGTTHGAHDRLVVAVHDLREAEKPKPRYTFRPRGTPLAAWDDSMPCRIWDRGRELTLRELLDALNAADAEGRTACLHEAWEEIGGARRCVDCRAALGDLK